MTIILQSYTRGWQARKRARHLRIRRDDSERFAQEQEARRLAEAEEVKRAEIERRMHPRTKQDFDILYQELEAWRFQETRKIKEVCLRQVELSLLMATRLRLQAHNELSVVSMRSIFCSH